MILSSITLSSAVPHVMLITAFAFPSKLVVASVLVSSPTITTTSDNPDSVNASLITACTDSLVMSLVASICATALPTMVFTSDTFSESVFSG